MGHGDPRPLVASARTAVQSFAAGECAAAAAQPIISLACSMHPRDSEMVYFFWAGRRPPALRWGIESRREGSLIPLVKDESRSLLASALHDASQSSAADTKRAITQPLTHQSATAIAIPKQYPSEATCRSRNAQHAVAAEHCGITL